MRLLQCDLELIGHECAASLSALRGCRLFVTGGTGFFGRWLLESLEWANADLALGVSATVLTRSSSAFAAQMPHLTRSPLLHFIEGDVRSLPAECNERGPYDFIVHMATDTDAASHRDPIRLFDSIVGGARNVLDLAVRSRAAGVLITSSGAVYGRQPSSLTHIPETYPGAPDPLSSGSLYGEGKRVCELLGAAYLAEHALPVKIARCFAFVGPHLPLDAHFAVGNFIRDALAGKSIEISGDGSPYRSYLYAADLIIWLWTILLNAPPGTAFNVGSGEAVTIADAAHIVARCVTPALPVNIARAPNPSIPPEQYVPSIDKAATLLGLRQTVTLPDAITRTLEWHRAKNAFAAADTHPTGF